jgi:putative DNA primase/helicase
MNGNPGAVNLAAALGYAARGWLILPCDPTSKRPITAHGLHDATIDETQIKTWWTEWPFAMVAVRTGSESGIWVLDPDVDRENGADGLASFAALEQAHGALPDTPRCRTPRGGEHIYFRWHDGVRNSTGRVGAQIDVRGESGYVIVPPA